MQKTPASILMGLTVMSKIGKNELPILTKMNFGGVIYSRFKINTYFNKLVNLVYPKGVSKLPKSQTICKVVWYIEIVVKWTNIQLHV